MTGREQPGSGKGDTGVPASPEHPHRATGFNGAHCRADGAEHTHAAAAATTASFVWRGRRVVEVSLDPSGGLCVRVDGGDGASVSRLLAVALARAIFGHEPAPGPDRSPEKTP